MAGRNPTRPRQGTQVLDWRERIVLDPGILAGKPIVRGTRIAVELVVDLLANGWTSEQILAEYDHLTADDVLACLAYASDVMRSEIVHPPEP